jgi:tripartite-type tricarboxylate transporter receptor subunit TctC
LDYETDRGAIKTALAVGRAFAATPEIPADRAAILREALAKVLADPEVGSFARKAQIDFQHIAAEEVLKGMTTILHQSSQVEKEMIKYIKF